MKRTRKWHNALTIKELRHLKEMCEWNKNPSLEQLQSDRRHQLSDDLFTCWDCERIERKLVEAGHLDGYVTLEVTS